MTWSCSTKGVSSGPLSFMRFSTPPPKRSSRAAPGAAPTWASCGSIIPTSWISSCANGTRPVLTNFNISVGITEAFMEAVEKDADYDIVNPRTGKRRPSAQRARCSTGSSIWPGATASPASSFSTASTATTRPRISVKSKRPIPAVNNRCCPTNPATSVRINLAKMVTKTDRSTGTTWQKSLQLATRFLDNVIEVNKYPLPEIDEMTSANRKIGLGVMGWADMLILLGIPYNSDDAIDLGEKVMNSSTTSRARRRRVWPGNAGPSPTSRAASLNGGEPVRNATCTTIAPTGTISIICQRFERRRTAVCRFLCAPGS